MEFLLVIAILVLIACVVELVGQNEDLQRQNDFLRERWVHDIEQDIKQAERNMERIDRYLED